MDWIRFDLSTQNVGSFRIKSDPIGLDWIGLDWIHQPGSGSFLDGDWAAVDIGSFYFDLTDWYFGLFGGRRLVLLMQGMRTWTARTRWSTSSRASSSPRSSSTHPSTSWSVCCVWVWVWACPSTFIRSLPLSLLSFSLSLSLTLSLSLSVSVSVSVVFQHPLPFALCGPFYGHGQAHSTKNTTTESLKETPCTGH